MPMIANATLIRTEAMSCVSPHASCGNDSRFPRHFYFTLACFHLFGADLSPVLVGLDDHHRFAMG